jgi:hypothetical protein
MGDSSKIEIFLKNGDKYVGSVNANNLFEG